MILVDDIFVYLNEDMPEGSREMVCPNPDNTYTILINATLTHEQRVESFWHAIGHIKENDYERAALYGTQMVEAEAHSNKGGAVL